MKEITIGIVEDLIPDGYEVVAISDIVKPGETYLNGSDWEPVVSDRPGDWEPDWPVLILEKKKRWRATRGYSYYFITSHGTIEERTESGSGADDARYEFGNYFKPGSQEIKSAAERVKKVYSSD